MKHKHKEHKEHKEQKTAIDISALWESPKPSQSIEKKANPSSLSDTPAHTPAPASLSISIYERKRLAAREEKQKLKSRSLQSLQSPEALRIAKLKLEVKQQQLEAQKESRARYYTMIEDALLLKKQKHSQSNEHDKEKKIKEEEQAMIKEINKDKKDHRDAYLQVVAKYKRLNQPLPIEFSEENLAKRSIWDVQKIYMTPLEQMELILKTNDVFTRDDFNEDGTMKSFDEFDDDGVDES